MDLPNVSLDTEPRPCRQPPPAPVTAYQTVSGDGRGDAMGDGRTDARGDGRGDAARPAGPVLTLSPDALTGDEEDVWCEPCGVRHRPPACNAGLRRNLPVVVLTARRPLHARLWLIVRHWATRWWQSAERAVKNPRGPYHAHPESLADHDAYRRSRAWVPPGHDGKILGPAGAGYHLTLAKFGMTTGYGWAWLWARPLRITIAAVVVGGIVFGFWLG